MLFIKRKYPLVTLQLYKIILGSTILFLILYVLRPFGFYNYSGNILLASIIFGLITFCCICFFNYLVKKKLYRSVKKWTLLSEIIYVLSIIFFISFFNFLYLSKILNQTLNFYFLFSAVYYTVILGIIVSAVITFEYRIGVNTHLGKYVVSPENVDNIKVAIQVNLIHEKDLEINLSDFVYAEAEKNNVMIYYFNNGVVESKLIRTTLSALIKELNYPNIFQCHRSFIVNLKNMESAKGNSNGYQIALKGCKNKIQVSRKYVNDFKSFIY